MREGEELVRITQISISLFTAATLQVLGLRSTQQWGQEQRQTKWITTNHLRPAGFVCHVAHE